MTVIFLTEPNVGLQPFPQGLRRPPPFPLLHEATCEKALRRFCHAWAAERRVSSIAWRKSAFLTLSVADGEGLYQD